MSHYWKKCPHCGKTIEQSSGSPTSYFGNPIKQCKYCHKIYNDKNVVDWENASIFKKISYYFANGRIAICLLPYMFSAALFGRMLDWKLSLPLCFLCCLPIFLALFALCVVYVEIQARCYYGKETNSKWFKSLAKICNFLSLYLKPIFFVSIIVFLVICFIIILI